MHSYNIAIPMLLQLAVQHSHLSLFWLLSQFHTIQVIFPVHITRLIILISPLLVLMKNDNWQTTHRKPTSVNLTALKHSSGKHVIYNIKMLWYTAHSYFNVKSMKILSHGASAEQQTAKDNSQKVRIETYPNCIFNNFCRFLCIAQVSSRLFIRFS